MVRRLTPLLLILLAGCGGSGSGAGSNPFSGYYVIPFSRGTTSHLVLHVNPDGSVGVQITDDATGKLLFSGTGHIDSQGNLDLTLQSAPGSSGTVTLHGTISRNGVYTVFITLTGSITSSGMTGTQTLNSPYAGTYNISYQGTDSGTATLEISNANQVTGQLNFHNIPLPVAGSIDSDGVASFGISGTYLGVPYNLGFNGSLALVGSGPIGLGTWTGPAGANGGWTLATQN